MERKKSSNNAKTTISKVHFKLIHIIPRNMGLYKEKQKKNPRTDMKFF
jgi:hypothetical protein